MACIAEREDGALGRKAAVASPWPATWGHNLLGTSCSESLRTGQAHFAGLPCLGPVRFFLLPQAS